MPVAANLFAAPAPQALVTTALRVDPGPGVRAIYLIGDAEIRLAYDDSVADGGVFPAGYLRIPTGLMFLAPVSGRRLLVAAATTANLTLLPV